MWMRETRITTCCLHACFPSTCAWLSGFYHHCLQSTSFVKIPSYVDLCHWQQAETGKLEELEHLMTDHMMSRNVFV